MYFQPDSLCPKYWGTVIIIPKESVMKSVDISQHFNMLVRFHVMVFGISYVN